MFYVVLHRQHAVYCANLMREHGVIDANKSIGNDQTYKFNGGGSMRFVSLPASPDSRYGVLVYKDHAVEERSP